jgi:hypothetical protein
MGMAELGGPLGLASSGALLVDEGQEREDGGQLARGNDRVAAIEAAPERCRAWRSGGC